MYDKDDLDTPHTQSSVSLKLSLIQQRCSQLMNESDGLTLALEEPDTTEDNDPYNRAR